MILPENFQFSQGSLQDFVDCRRRFQLRYLKRLAWPALRAEPALEAERFLQQGALFHRLVQAYLLGVPAESLSGLIQNENLERWWGNYTQHGVDLTGLKLYPEISLSAPFGDFRLVAKYDLITTRPDGQMVIYDWKTSRVRTKQCVLAGRLQTRVYPYLLVRAGAHLNQGTPLQSGKIEMVYWFADYPTQPERFVYTESSFQEDEGYLLGLVEAIQRLEEDQFPLTDDERRCAFCVYRSLCDRGVKAGGIETLENELEEEEAIELDLDFEQIAEIEF